MNIASLSAQFRTWWRKQTPHRQDRFALLGPIVSVLLFLIVILASFAYLRLEEIDREQESIKRDVEEEQDQFGSQAGVPYPPGAPHRLAPQGAGP